MKIMIEILHLAKFITDIKGKGLGVLWDDGG